MTTKPATPPDKPSVPDPFALARKLLNDLESNSNSALNRAMRSEAFMSLFGRSNRALLMMQSLMGQWMPRWLALWHMPSREEINELGERLQSIEDQLWRIHDTVGRSPEAREQALQRQRVDRPAKTLRPRPPQVDARAIDKPPASANGSSAPIAPAPAVVASAEEVPAPKAKRTRAPRKTATRATPATPRSRSRP